MIPRRFKLVNKSWLVRVVTTKQLQKHLDTHWNEDDDTINAGQLYGLCDPGASRIFINKDMHQNQEEMEHTFFHELMHCILFADGQSDHDEAYVDRMGGFLHQIVRTRSGENVSNKPRETEETTDETRGGEDETLPGLGGDTDDRSRS